MSSEGPEPAVLGIDWGSTAVRAILVSRRNQLSKLVWNSGSIPGHDERYQKGAFGSAICLDSDGETYLGETMDENRLPVPSKLFFSENPKTGLESIDSLLEKPDTANLWSLVDEGMKAILRKVLKEAITVCSEVAEGGPFYVSDVSLSYSAHWGQYERDRYECLLLKVISESAFNALNTHKPEISFVQESLSSAHNLFSSAKHVSQVLGTSDKPKLLVFLDFGGHTLNGCMFSVVKRENQNLSYLRVGATFATKGGTQHWERETGKIAAQKFAADWKTDLPLKQRAEILEAFHLQIKKWKSNTVSRLGLPYTAPDLMSTSTLNFSADEVLRCFQAALSGPLRLATEKISEAYALGEDVQVIVSGGSGKNSVLQHHIEEACLRAKISRPYFFYETAGPHDSWNIAKGAAICIAQDSTVEDFLKRGAVFGFQKSFRHGGASSRIDHWNSNVEVALGWSVSRPLKSYFSGTSRLKIICNPLLSPNSTLEKLDIDEAYDLIELPMPITGYWEFRMSLEKSEDAVSLIVQRSSWGTNGKRRISTKQYPRLPLHLEKASNCCLIETDVEDNGRGLLLLECGTLRACPESTIRDQVAELQRNRGKVPLKRSQTESRKSSPKRKKSRLNPRKVGNFDLNRLRATAPVDETTETAEMPEISDSIVANPRKFVPINKRNL